MVWETPPPEVTPTPTRGRSLVKMPTTQCLGTPLTVSRSQVSPLACFIPVLRAEPSSVPGGLICSFNTMINAVADGATQRTLLDESTMESDNVSLYTEPSIEAVGTAARCKTAAVRRTIWSLQARTRSKRE